MATAQPLCNALGLVLQERAGLNEIAYGKWEGLTKERVEHEFHEDYRNWLADPAWHSPTEGETAAGVVERGLQVIEGIKQQFSEGSVLLVSHKATIRIILCDLLGIDVDASAID